MANPSSPWHMWGTSVRQSLVLSAPGSRPIESNQLSRVNYKRPETWRFLLWGRLVGGSTPAAAVTSVHVLFDLYVGVGRSVLSTQRPDDVLVLADCFLDLHWLVPVGTIPGHQPGNIKYATRVQGPVLDDSTATSGQLIDHVVAEDITCRARAFINAGDAVGTTTAQIEFGAFFSPNTHVRPDWLARRGDQFRGGEIGGS